MLVWQLFNLLITVYDRHIVGDQETALCCSCRSPAVAIVLLGASVGFATVRGRDKWSRKGEKGLGVVNLELNFKVMGGKMKLVDSWRGFNIIPPTNIDTITSIFQIFRSLLLGAKLSSSLFIYSFDLGWLPWSVNLFPLQVMVIRRGKIHRSSNGGREMHMFHCTAMTQSKVRTHLRISTRTCILIGDAVAWFGLMELLWLLPDFPVYLTLEPGHICVCLSSTVRIYKIVNFFWKHVQNCF